MPEETEVDHVILEYNTEEWAQAELLRYLRPDLRPHAPRIYHEILLWMSRGREDLVVFAPPPFNHIIWTESGVRRLLVVVGMLSRDEDVDDLMDLIGGDTNWKRTAS